MIHALRFPTALAVCLSLGACAGGDMGFDSVTSGSFFGDAYLKDTSDPCIAQRRAMADQGSFFDKELIVAAATGAALGAATGGLIAAVSGQNVLAGAAIGGGLGLAGGYLAKLYGEGLDGDGIIGHAFNDVAAENRKIDALLVSFRSLKSCRLNEARAIQAAYNAKTIDKAQAQAQMAGVRMRYDQDVAKLDQIAMQISENTESYAAVYNEIAADNNAGALEVQDYREGAPSAKVTRKTPPRKSSTPQGSLQASNKQNVEKLQDECLTNVRKRDECIEEIQASKKDTEEMELDLG
jgi:hypothetical protein